MTEVSDDTEYDEGPELFDRGLSDDGSTKGLRLGSRRPRYQFQESLQSRHNLLIRQITKRTQFAKNRCNFNRTGLTTNLGVRSSNLFGRAICVQNHEHFRSCSVFDRAVDGAGVRPFRRPSAAARPAVDQRDSPAGYRSARICTPKPATPASTAAA